MGCSNAKKGPHSAYNAYKQFVQIDTTALFLAAAMEHFHLDDVTVQVNATLSPRVAHDVTWNRFWNNRGGKGKNIPLDLHLEHLNNFLKSFLRNKGTNLTEQTADRVSRSAGVLKNLMDTADRELQLSQPSGIHHAADLQNNILTVLEVFRKTEVFKHQPGRHFSAFPTFDRNILSKLNYKDLWQWMRARLKDWRAVAL